jgi:hypothetical protein
MKKATTTMKKRKSGSKEGKRRRLSLSADRCANQGAE